MDDLTHMLNSLRHNVVPEWGSARSDRAYREIARVRRLRRVRNISIGAGFVVAGLALFLAPVPPQRGTETASAPVLVPFEVYGPEPGAVDGEPFEPQLAVAEPEVLHGGRSARLADGSIAEVTTAQGSLIVEINQPNHVSMRLSAGTAHFDVIPNTQRQFSVFADGVEVVVVGTVFDVERADRGVRVAVSHGAVRVRSESATTFVQAGEARWFEPSKRAKVPARAERQVPSARSPSQPSVAAPRAPAPAPATWRSLSRTGDYDGAYSLLSGGAQIPNDPESLMEAADAARLSNHPQTAVLYLRQVIDQHRGNPATPLAAFTLGRVLLERLGRPAEAAEAFATARELAPRGSLAQDALAREVESWSKAGHAKEAYDRSRLFMERYPEGPRLRVVQLYGGIETSR